MTPGPCPGVGTCDFETDTCGWIQRRDDVFDWTRRRGPTPSVSTGPSVDHTLGTTTGKSIVSSPYMTEILLPETLNLNSINISASVF